MSLLLGDWKLPVHYVLSLLLLWSCFCRFTYTCKTNTRWDIRWSFNLLALTAVCSLAVPMVASHYGRPWEPDLMHVLMLLAITTVQLVTSTHWRHGVPPPYRKPDKEAR